MRSVLFQRAFTCSAFLLVIAAALIPCPSSSQAADAAPPVAGKAVVPGELRATPTIH